MKLRMLPSLRVSVKVWAEVINEFRNQGESSTLQALQEEVPEGISPFIKNSRTR